MGRAANLCWLDLSAGHGNEPAPGVAWEVRALAALERRASGRRHLALCYISTVCVFSEEIVIQCARIMGKTRR